MSNLIMNNKRKFAARLFLTILFVAAVVGTFLVTPSTRSVTAQSQSNSVLQTPQVEVFFFWGAGCEHCEEEKVFLSELLTRYPALVIHQYEVKNDKENRDLLFAMAEEIGFQALNVPVTVLGRNYWIGFNEQVKIEIQNAIQAAFNPGVVPFNPVSGGTTSDNTCSIEDPEECADTNIVKLPIIGEIDLNAQSLTLSTILISFVDGVNPCSLWVLTMLMSLTIHIGSRKKVLVIGLVFLTVTAVIYALFIFGVFSVFSLVSVVGWIQLLVALLALFFAFVNIKDYFWYKEGVSLTISEKDKPGIFRNIRKVISLSDNFWAMIGATIVLAAGVSLVEFACTAGFPVIWTNLLVAHGVTSAQFVGLLLVYLLVYQADELVIFFASVVTLKASKLEEKHGRVLKLFGGLLMLALAIVMLVDPNLMNQLSSVLIIFGLAVGVTLLILLVHRVILPRFGVHIGTELNKKNRSHSRGGD